MPSNLGSKLPHRHHISSEKLCSSPKIAIQIYYLIPRSCQKPELQLQQNLNLAIQDCSRFAPAPATKLVECLSFVTEVTSRVLSCKLSVVVVAMYVFRNLGSSI
jgi:hypothetical protein